MIIQAQWPGRPLRKRRSQVTDRIEKKLEELESLDYTRPITTLGPDHDLPQSAGHHQGRRRRAHVGASPQHDHRHQRPVPARRRRPRLQRPLRRRLTATSTHSPADGVTQRQLRDYVEQVRAKVLTVPNVGKVNMIGAQDEVDLSGIFAPQDRGIRH